MKVTIWKLVMSAQAGEKKLKSKKLIKTFFQFLNPADCSYLGLLSVSWANWNYWWINLEQIWERIFSILNCWAAIAGRRLDYVPVAFSVAAYNPKNLGFISEQSLLITNQVSKLPSDQNLLVNVNFPDLPSSEIKGTCITSLGKRGIPDTPDLIREKDSSKFYSFGPSALLTKQEQISSNWTKLYFYFNFDYNLKWFCGLGSL